MEVKRRKGGLEKCYFCFSQNLEVLDIDIKSKELFSSFVVYSKGEGYDFPIAVVMIEMDAEFLVKQSPNSRYYEKYERVIKIG